MTREESIEILKGSIISEERGKDGKPNGNITCDLTREVLEMAIKALEQESVLDKIRAEIAEEAEYTVDGNRAGGLYKALQIINKYKEESEDKE